jgi:hypothetical protein
MHVRRRVLMLGAAAGAMLAACTAPVPLDASPVEALPAPVPDWIGLRVGEADDGRRVELPVGDSIAVTVRVPAAAGLGWVLLGQPPGVAQTGRYSGPVWPPGAPGSAALPTPLWQVFVFEARRLGEGELAFELDGAVGASRARRLGIRVTVVPAR